MRTLITFGWILLVCQSVSGQNMVAAKVAIDASGKKTYDVTFSFRPKPVDDQPVIGAPYSAVEVTDQVLPDGSRPEEPRVNRVLFRDSQGRTRCERNLFLGAGTPEGPLVVEITDPVSGYIYTLDRQNKIAHRTFGPKQGVSAGKVQSSGTSEPRLVQRPVTKAEEPAKPGVEKLGVRDFEGVSAEGTRTMHAMGSGPEGDGRPIVTITEIWTSPELKTVVFSRLTDTNNGVVTTSLTKIRKTESDPSLFKIPGDYRIKEEGGDFEMTFTVGK